MVVELSLPYLLCEGICLLGLLILSLFGFYLVIQYKQLFSFFLPIEIPDNAGLISRCGQQILVI